MHLHQLAVMAGATALGNPPQYLFSAKQLAELVRMVDPHAAELIALADRLEAAGKNPVLTV
jgi:hypothetical protein